MIAPKESVSVPLTYAPTTVGHLAVTCELFVCAANGDTPADPSGPGEPGVEECVLVPVRGTCSALPVHFAQEHVDLRTCLVGRTYAGTILIANTSNVAARATLSFPTAARSMLQIANKALHIQPKTTLSVPLRFRPSPEIFELLSEHSNAESGLVGLPVTLAVDGQTLDSEVSVRAHVTPATLLPEPSTLAFGAAGAGETVCMTLALRNCTALPQRVGFVELPADVAVQPGCGFATLLPFETASFDVLFSPGKREPGAHTFDLTVAWAAGRVTVPCSASITASPIAASASALLFAGTPLNGRSTTTLVLTNTSTQPRDLELLSSISSVTASPATLTLSPDKQATVRVIFAPREPGHAVGNAGSAFLSAASRAVGAKAFNADEAIHVRLDLPVVAPSATLIPGDGGFAFGSAPVGQRSVRAVSIHNTTDRVFTPRLSPFDPYGPFVLLNALRPVLPGQQHAVRVAFQPAAAGHYAELLTVTCESTVLRVPLSGEGLPAALTLSATEIAFPDVVAGQVVDEKLRLTNTSSFPIVCTLETVFTPGENAFARDPATNFPMLLRTGDGDTNVCGSAFRVWPTRVTVAPGQPCDVTVWFAPDRPGEQFAASIHARYGDAMSVVRVRGRAWRSAATLAGTDPVAPGETDALSALDTSTEPDRTLIFRIPATAERTERLKVARDITLGVVKAAAAVVADKGKKAPSTDFTVDFAPGPGPGGDFAVDAPKGSLEAGATRKLIFTLSVPEISPLILSAGVPRTWLMATATITLRSETTSTRFRISLCGVLV